MKRVEMNHPHEPRRSLGALVTTLALAVASLTGCAATSDAMRPDASSAELSPIAPPSEPTLLAAPAPRKLGPLRPASEAELELTAKSVPFGTVATELLSVDTDTSVRAIGPEMIVNSRVTEHRGRLRRKQVLGVTPQGLVRVQVDYLRDATILLNDGKKVATAKPVEGKSYVLDVGPGGIRVFTIDGYTPSAEEISIVLEDHKQVVSPSERRTDTEDAAALRPASERPLSASDKVSATVRRSFENNGFRVRHVAASLKGVRELAGTPCAIFNVEVLAKKAEISDEETITTEMRLSGEYSIRLGDGWEAELLLQGTVTADGEVTVEGTPVRINTAGLTRIHVATTYEGSESLRPRRLETLSRSPTTDPSGN
jgi:hypothetical protein